MEEGEESKEPAQETPKQEAPKEPVKQEAPKEPVKQEDPGYTPKQEKTKAIKERKPLFSKTRDRFQRYKRTLEVTKKPDKEEYKNSAKITGFGIVVLGIIGFVIFILYHLVIP